MDISTTEPTTAQLLPLLPFTHKFINLEIYQGKALEEFLKKQQDVLDTTSETNKNFVKQAGEFANKGRIKDNLGMANLTIDNGVNDIKTNMLSLEAEYKRYKVLAKLIEAEVCDKKSK